MQCSRAFNFMCEVSPLWHSMLVFITRTKIRVASFDIDPGPYEMAPGGAVHFSHHKSTPIKDIGEGQVGGESELGGQVGLGKVLWKEAIMRWPVRQLCKGKGGHMIMSKDKPSFKCAWGIILPRSMWTQSRPGGV